MEETVAKEVATALAGAEKRLKRVIAATAQVGEYSLSKAASAVAENLVALREKLPRPSEQTGADGLRKSSNSASPSGKSRRERPQRRKYPRFEMHGDYLHRVGWSKKEREEYTHKAERGTYEHVARAMSALAGTTEQPISAEQIWEYIQANGSAVASYQMYVVIGFLKAQGVIKQRGRAGYEIPNDVRSQASSIWK